MNEITAVHVEAKTVDELGKLAQMQALTGDAVTIKMAELEKKLRADKVAYENKGTKLELRRQKDQESVEKLGKTIAVTTCRPEARKIFNALKKYFSFDHPFEEMFDFSWPRWSMDKGMDTLTVEVDSQICICDAQNEDLSYEISNVTVNYPEFLRYYNELLGLKDEIYQIRDLIKEIDGKLKDRDYIERQVKAEISKHMFKAAGMEDILNTIKSLDVFEVDTSRAIECTDSED